ncbi:hypothetical protein TA3x_004915 [Tundrisphaera sp. TA3]|uniref:hypothetical protein n=1 Tax=Tundrisphaera sp. TA3 TaxID=3435775 RepID=UPI003EBEE977
MHILARGLATLALIVGPASIGMAQATKTVPPPAGPRPTTTKERVTKTVEVGEAKSGGFRTLTGTIGEITPGAKTLSLVLPEAGAKGARAAQTWGLATGKQTLLMKAGKNGQFTTIDFDGLAKGETIQAVAELETDAGKMHRTWWLIVYPAGTTPPSP